MVYAQPSICPGQCDIQIPQGFRHINRSPSLSQTTRSYNSQQKKRTRGIEDFAVPADHRVKLKEVEKKDNYLDLARELKKTVEHDVLGTVTGKLMKGHDNLEITGRAETIQTTALLRSARILRRVLDTRGDLLSTKLQ